jgi:hypothetical protein
LEPEQLLDQRYRKYRQIGRVLEGETDVTISPLRA